MRPLQKKGVFPPQKIQIDAARLSFWKELQVLFYVVAFFVAESLGFSLSSDNLENLSCFCANSKRKRLPKLLSFSLSA